MLTVYRIRRPLLYQYHISSAIWEGDWIKSSILFAGALLIEACIPFQYKGGLTGMVIIDMIFKTTRLYHIYDENAHTIKTILHIEIAKRKKPDPYCTLRHIQLQCNKWWSLRMPNSDGSYDSGFCSRVVQFKINLSLFTKYYHEI